MKTFIALFAALSLALIAAAQPPDTLWTHTYGGPNVDIPYCVRQTTDSGYIIVGTTKSFGAGNEDVYLVKTDAVGNQIWQRTFGGSSYDYGKSVQQTSDGGYIIAGYTYSFGVNIDDVYLIKTDTNGGLIWQRIFGVGSWNEGYSVQQTSDGGFIIAGCTVPSGGFATALMIKTDANGHQVWQHTYGAGNSELAYSVQQTSDGGYVFAGEADNGYADVYLVKTDANGNQTWQHTFGNLYQNEKGLSVQQTSDDGYIIAGDSCYDVYLIKTDVNGNQTWEHTLGGSSTDIGRSVQQTSDGGYIVAGITMNYGPGDKNIYLVKTDPFGNLIWQRNYGNGNSEGYCVRQASDGGYIIAGSTGSSGGGMADFYLIKTNAACSARLSVMLFPLNASIYLSPNGGSFQFNGTVQRIQAPQSPFYVWTRDRFPNGSYTDNLMGPVQINPPVGMAVTRLRTQLVPASWPSGTHRYIGYVNPTVSYPVTNADSFYWGKAVSSGDGILTWEASCLGEPFPGEVFPPSKSEVRGDLFASPNPFNSTAAISYQLSASSHVSLKVYDTAGRLVATLADGWREAGTHEATFDGSELPSGMYFVRLQSGELTAVQKMVLMK